MHLSDGGINSPSCNANLLFLLVLSDQTPYFCSAHLCCPIWTPCNFNIPIISLESVEWSCRIVNQAQKCRETAPSQVSLQYGKLETPALAWQGNASPKCWDVTGEFGGDCQTLDMLIKELLADGFAEERSSGWLSPVAKTHSDAHNLASQKPQPLTELSAVSGSVLQCGFC